MASREFVNLIEGLCKRAVEAPNKFQPQQRNEEWTKVNFILPVLEGLGWDIWADVLYEDSPRDFDGRLDFVLKWQCLIGIEAKAFDVKSPQDRNHPHIRKGLRQCKEREASYFIWTNGDCWQFASLALPNAPVFQITLSSQAGKAEYANLVCDRFEIIAKSRFCANPKHFDDFVLDNWKKEALPGVLHTLMRKHTSDFIRFVRQALPNELSIGDAEILEFFERVMSLGSGVAPHLRKPRHLQQTHSFPEDWRKLIESYEPDYERARQRLSQGYYRTLAEYLLSERYQPWSKSTSWRHAGVANEPNERKKLGPVISLLREWQFITEDADGKYRRVEEGVPYFEQLLKKQPDS